MPSSPLRPRWTRRGLLRGALGASTALAAFQAVPTLTPRARAAALKDRSYIFCYFQGGWDLLMCLDPRDPGVFRDDLKKVTRIQPGYGELDSAYQSLVETEVEGMTFGPAIGALAGCARDLCVVRGMSMDTLTHEVGRRRFITGKPPAGLQAKGTAVATVLASYLGSDQPIPQLSVAVESYNTDQPSYASAIKVSSVEDLVRALSRSEHDLSEAVQAELDAFLASYGDCRAASASAFRRDALAYRDASKALVAQGLDALFDFGDDSAEMEEIRDRYGFEADDLESAGAQAASAVTAITAGISRVVCIQPAGDLDQHGPEWATAHPERLEAGFDLVAAMIEDLRSREYGDTGESWLEHTTIVGFSEFGRTPLLNSSGGRDHYLHNACFLAGGGVRGGVVLGASSDVGMAPTPTDLETGLSADDGETIRPEHVWRALLVDCGIEEDAADLEVEPLSAIYG